MIGVGLERVKAADGLVLDSPEKRSLYCAIAEYMVRPDPPADSGATSHRIGHTGLHGQGTGPIERLEGG
jgi:hypothetical protein